MTSESSSKVASKAVSVDNATEDARNINSDAILNGSNSNKYVQNISTILI
jgi:hypothetical protein